MKIGSRIADARKQLKMSQTDLVDKVGVSHEIIGSYKRNEVSPSIEIPIRFAVILNTSLD